MSRAHALLLSDIVNSTEITRTLGDAAAVRLWQQHDRIARDLLQRWNGLEVDKTDGILMLFSNVGDAVDCATAYHAALEQAGLPFTCRLGIHLGPVTLLENSAADVARGAKPLEAEGLAVPTVARVMAVAQGGQTLISDAAYRALVLSHGDDGTGRCRSHGYWRLGGLDEPQELFELVRDGFAADPPQDRPKAYRVRREGGLWKPLREIANNLPAERDSFVGRHDPLHRLAAWLDGGARLVTVSGMGGMGKTRLALRCAWSWLGEHPGGVWFCDLAPARDVAGLRRAVAQGIGVPLGGTNPQEQLTRAIRGHGRCLVILDNFEHLVSFAPETVGEWLDHAPDARFVVTSRERLSLVGEVVLDLQPMEEQDAVELFLRRAAATGAGIAAGGAEQPTVRELVGMLDRLPLAIELAAARARVMSPQTLVSRMHQRFALLASKTGRDERRSTLRATLDWSWELLGPQEKALLAQLAVFVGGFTLEACEQVAALPLAGGELAVVDALQSLIDRSLVRRTADDRFDLLQTVAAYAAAQLARDPAGAAAAADRHSRYYASLGPQRAVAHACIELDNLMAACKHAVASKEGDTATRALAATHAAVSLRGPWQSLAELAEAVLALPCLDDRQRLSALLDSAHAAQFGGAVAKAQARFAQAAELARHVAEPALQARALRAEADALLRAGDAEGWSRVHANALAAAEASGDIALRCTLLNRAGAVAELRGQPEAARARYEEALALASRHGERRWEGGSAGNLGQLLANRGEFVEASRMYRQAIGIAQELGDRQWEANARCNLGLLELECGRPDAALPELAHAEAAARALGHPRLLAIVQCNLGLVRDELGDLDAAEGHLRTALIIARELADPRSEGQFLGYLGWLLARLGRLAEAREAFQRGEALLASFNDALSTGIHIAHSAMAEALAGETRRASELLSAAEGLAKRIPDLRPESELARAVSRAQVELARATSRVSAC